MTISKTTFTAALLLLLVVASAFGAITVSASPIIGMEQPLYTRTNKEAYLKGSGLSTGTYFIWMSRPDQNSTGFTGVSFQSAADGSIPSETKISIGPEYPLGTYKVSISKSQTADGSLAQCHFGLWGTEKSVYQRTDTVGISGGGIWPGSSLNLIVRNPVGSFVFNSTIASNVNGTFSARWKVSNNAPSGSYDIFVDGTGTFDNSEQEYFHKKSLTVTPANLNISVHANPEPTYQRTDSAIMDILVKYPDGSPMLSMAEGIMPVVLVKGSIVVKRLTPVLTDDANGVWRTAWNVPVNATPGSEYRFEINPQEFDDGFKNVGSSEPIVSNTFKIVAAQLAVSVETNQSDYQVAFQSIGVRSLITYPSGAFLTNGTAYLQIIHGQVNQTIPMIYDNSTGFWYATRSLSVLDISQIGTWKLIIQAEDGIGNNGMGALEVGVQPWFMVLTIVGLIILLFFLVRGIQWFRRRYGRNLRGISNIRTPFKKTEPHLWSAEGIARALEHAKRKEHPNSIQED